MKILLLTSVYPAEDLPKGVTSVVHFFTKEWVKMGHDVRVIHYVTNFPLLYYKVLSLFHNYIASRVGFVINIKKTPSKVFVKDGVVVKRIPMKKVKPHARYSSKQINLAQIQTLNYCQEEGFTPDVIVGHWENPQLEIISRLKAVFQVPTALVLHGNGHVIAKLYPHNYKKLLSAIDLFGFRCRANKEEFEQLYGQPSKYFYCYSGIPELFVSDSSSNKRSFSSVQDFVFVGTLIKRKYPSVILSALIKNYKDQPFSINYIGEGDELSVLQKYSKQFNMENNVFFRGRISRNEVKNYLEKADVFIMISKNEVYGLVYLEAMAAGCITIASRNEGFDGIIIDGVNGFLCKAGDVKELTEIIRKIKMMSSENLQKISRNAIQTALELTDHKVAYSYVQELEKLLN